MERDALEQLRAWKGKKRRKPLIVEGARQVGKTWLLKEFGSAYDILAVGKAKLKGFNNENPGDGSLRGFLFRKAA